MHLYVHIRPSYSKNVWNFYISEIHLAKETLFNAAYAQQTEFLLQKWQSN